MQATTTRSTSHGPLPASLAGPGDALAHAQALRVLAGVLATRSTTLRERVEATLWTGSAADAFRAASAAGADRLRTTAALAEEAAAALERHAAAVTEAGGLR